MEAMEAEAAAAVAVAVGLRMQEGIVLRATAATLQYF